MACLYIFIAIAIVVDDYFIAALDKLCAVRHQSLGNSSASNVSFFSLSSVWDSTKTWPAQLSWLPAHRRRNCLPLLSVTSFLSSWFICFDRCHWHKSRLLTGIFVAKGDVGVGTIVGSAVFNIVCVIGVCGLFVNGVSWRRASIEWLIVISWFRRFDSLGGMPFDSVEAALSTFFSSL